MTIKVFTSVFREMRFIDACIGQFEPFGLGHIVSASLTPYEGDWVPDGTAEHVRSRWNDDRVLCWEGSWLSEAEKRNDGMRFVPSDWWIVADADEFYTAEDIGKLIDFIGSVPEDVDVIRPQRMCVYWSSPYIRLVPEQTDLNVIAMRPRARFRWSRDAEGNSVYAPVTMHHMSYVRDDEEMLCKIESNTEAYKIAEGWYENKWLAWQHNPEIEDLHPVVPEQFKRTEWDPAPAEIRTMLGEQARCVICNTKLEEDRVMEQVARCDGCER